LKLNIRFVFTILCVLFFSTVFGQEYSISGEVKDDQGLSIAYANIILIKELDSTITTGTSSDDLGKFITNKINSGSYIIKVSFIGFEDFSKTILLENDIVLETIVLKESVETLSEVELVYKKPTLKKEADRLVFNVANTALIEGTMLQVIKSTPGILVLDSGISIKGSEPTVYINDRKVHLSSSELTELLESSSANSIKSIEVITNPSAKYDAESGAVVNIVMSKNLISGYRGSLFTNYTQGVFPRYNVGTSHFFKNEKISFNVNYNYTKSKINRDDKDVVNYVDSNSILDEVWTSTLNRNTWSDSHNLNYNFDYYLDDNNILSLSSTMLYVPYFKNRTLNNTIITDENSNFLSRFDSNSISKRDKYNFGFDLDFSHNFEKGQLSFNSHFTTYDFVEEQNVASNFFDINNVFETASAFITDANQNTNIFTSKIDYTIPIDDTSNFEAGIKYSKIQNESDITQFDIDINTGNETIDPLNSDAFNYNEDVFAGYSNYSLDTDKWSLNLGLRVEQTDTEGVSNSNNETNSQNYLEWFPNASLQRNFSDNFNLYANYKRSITRPDYVDLNPFQFFLNESTIIVGNPNLLPVFKDHYVIGTTLKKIFTVEAYYQNYENKIHILPIQNNETNIVLYTPVNLDKTIEFGFDFSTNFDASDDWSVYFVTSFYNIEEETNTSSGLVNKNQWSNYTVLQNDFTFLKDKSLTLNLAITYSSKSISGFREVLGVVFSDLSIRKTILKGKGSLSLIASDLFNDQKFVHITKYLNQDNTNSISLDNRYIKLGFRYKFGNTKLTTNEQTKDLEELDRLKESDH